MAEEMTPQLANTEETTQVAMEDVVEIVQKEMVLNIIVCKRISAEEEIVLDNSSEVSELVVPATEQTVLTLRSLISEKIAIDKAKFVLIASSASANTELEQDDKELFKDYHIATGSQIYVDVIPESFGTSIGKYISPVLTALEKKRLSATIFINDPSKATEEKDIAYDIPLEVKLDTSLSSIKVQIAALLKLEGVDSFHIKRSYGAPQLKDESKTLFDLAVMDQNSLYVQVRKSS